MEILRKYKENGYFTSDLYHLLANKKLVDPSEEIIPSVYLKEMKMSTVERLQNLNGLDIENLISSSRKNAKPVLAFTPRMIVFQNYQPNEKVIAKFSVKNISNAPAFLNMVFKESSNFFIKPCGAELLSRLAPGISVTFAITFLATKSEDYVHRVTFNTDVDHYVLPLIGMGPRPICDFPDEIVLPRTPLKIESCSLVNVHNISQTAAGYTLMTKCPFTIHPKSICLPIGLKAELKVTFKTMRLGEVKGKLLISCETGEVFCIRLIGTTYVVSIEMEKSVVRFLDTYNKMVRQVSYKIINKSDDMLTYMCMKNDCVFNDFEDKIKLATIFYDLKDSESAKYRKLVEYDVMSSDEHERVYTRIFFDEIQALVADESMSFQNMHFSIMPIKGKLWPNKTTEITLTFSPKNIGDFHTVAYIDIDGILERVPLIMQGTSLPPNITLNLETLDMDNVYINTNYNYEIVAMNRGHINGVIVYKPEASLFGSTITCCPEMHCLRPGDKEIFTISFMNCNQGPYFEELNFNIRDTDVNRKLYLKGEIIYPSLMFSVPCLDFGDVSAGVPKTLQLDVINDSVVNVNAHVKISSDGPEVSSFTLEDCDASGKMYFELPQWPREFKIEPSTILLGANSRITLKVILTANLVRTVMTTVELELDKSDSPPITLPVTYRCCVPDVIPANDINLRACFLDCVYSYDIAVQCNEFWGYFTIEQPVEESTLHVDVGVKRGIITPNSKLVLPITIMTGVLGVQEFTLRMYLFGKEKPIDICHIVGNGMRPIVTCSPLTLNWGQVKLLDVIYKNLTLWNDSPVTVHFMTSLLNHDGRWDIEPKDGYIEPESETDLVMSLCLTDAGLYSNKAFIQLEKVKDILVPLFACGVGTSITVGNQRDRVHLGLHFTKLPLESDIPIQNFGTRLHSLEWSHINKTNKNEVLMTPFFDLEPKIFKLAAKETMNLKITAASNKASIICETWFLIGNVEGVNKKELLLECKISAEFVDPVVNMSSDMIQFRYDFGPYSEFYKLTDMISIKNVSMLPLDIEVSIKPPFALIKKRGTYKIRMEDEHNCNCISYAISDLNVENIINEVGTKQSKVFIDCLTNKPVEPLRQEPLNFFQDIKKIKMAFHLTHSVEERLEDKEVLVLQIVFDTTKHNNLRSKVYSDLMRVKFKGHKNKDIIKLSGKINFPNLTILTPKIDFQCILNGSLASKTFKIHNPTPLMVCYKFQWKKCNMYVVPVPEVPKIEFDLTKLEKEISEDYEPSGSFAEEDLNLSPGEGTSNNEVTEPSMSKVDIVEKVESISIKDEETDFKAMKTRIMKKILPMLHIHNNPGFPWEHKFPKKEKKSRISVNDMFQLVPHRGLLKPFEMQYINVVFSPDLNISIRAVLECEVLGGPTEYITLTGQSSDIMFKLSAQAINFKIRSFHELATETLVISNIAQLPFDYKTYLNEPEFKNDLPAKICEIIPSEKVLQIEEEVHVLVVLRPGILGYFHRVFLLELGHLPYLPIEVFGWGVNPQIYFPLPREGLDTLPIELGYNAIATLSTDYLAAISDIFNTGTSEHLNSPLVEKCFEDPLFQEDWHICSTWDGYPSIMDIELAIERLMVVNHIKNRPEILTMYATTSKTIPIPGFQTLPYVIDFGVVMTGSTVVRSTEITNYSSIPVKVHFSRNTQIPAWFTVKLCGKLNPGVTEKIEIIFAPTSEFFTELEQNVETTFYIEVPFGPTVPVQIKALTAVPYLKSSVSIVDFGYVRCGDKVNCSIPIKNVGKPTCIWYVTLRLKSPGPNPMAILDCSGRYEAGQGGWLPISFKPTMEMTYEGVLIFRFHMNPIRTLIPVVGHGMCPHVHIIGPKLDFPPTLPWAETTDIYFGITNPCPFPVEVIIAHADEKWKEEDEILELLYRYYNKPEEMLIPIVKPGAGMPQEILNFHERFLANVKKAVADEAAAMKTTTKGAAKDSKKVKSPQKTAKDVKGKDKKDKGDKDKEERSPRRFRTEAEIISDEIKLMKEEGLDPINECIENINKNSKPEHVDKHGKGLLLFLHGSPCEEMECQEIAYTLGSALGIPTINFDLSVVEALCVCNCLAKTVILNVINEAYEKTADKNFGDLDAEGIIDETEDEFDILLRKIQYFVSSKNTGTPRSKASEKKKKDASSGGGSHTALPTGATIFLSDYLIDLLNEFFSLEKFQRGFVMDSLTSFLLKNPPLVLTTVMKCNSKIRNIHLVLGHSDFSTWAQAFEEAIHEAELAEEQLNKVVVYEDDEIEEIIKQFEEMDDVEYENANPELRSIYIQYGLEERKKKHVAKVGMSNDVSTIMKTKAPKGDTASVLLAISSIDSKKKVKKDDTRGKPNTEYNTIQSKYMDYFKTVFENLINIANNWIVEDGELGVPLYTFNGGIVGTLQKKTKKKSEVQLQDSEMEIIERGFPLTFLMVPCLQHKEALVNMFKNCPDIQQKLKIDEELDVLQCPVDRQEFTVLLTKTMPVVQHEPSLNWLYLDELPIKKCECNQITDLNLLDDSTQDNVLNILSKWHCTCGKKMTSSQTSTSEIPMPANSQQQLEKVVVGEESEDDFFYPLPLRAVQAIPVHGGRLILQPGDLVRCKYAFSPREEGNFSVKHFVEVAGWPESRVDINVTGICDLPRLDNRPKKIFANFVRRTIEDKVYKTTYLDEQKYFEFGPIFVGKQRIYEEEYTIDLRNSSLLTANVDIRFMEDTDVFTIDKEFIRLEPGCRGKLTISAAPSVVGVHNSLLLFCIKDNPEIIKISVTCKGVVPIVEILPLTKYIDYGKLLLYRREDDRFIVKNDSILPIMWKLRNAEEFVENFIISQTSGVIPRNDNQVVPVTYIACNVGTIVLQQLVIDIFDELGRGEPMIIDSMSFSAECYDVMIECAYENPNENFLNYGNVKVNSTLEREMYLLNRGNYSIFYKLKKVKNFPEPSLLKSFEAIPECGVIPPNLRLMCVRFQCTPTVALSLKHVPAYTCSLLDGNKDQVVVAKFPIYITIASFYNTFTLFPLGELNFHIIAVGSGVLREVILNNTSKCPFNYEIVIPEKYRDEVEIDTSAKSKDNKLRIPPIKCGNFLIINEDNLLESGTSRTISIQFLATAARKFEETIHFIVSDTCPAEASGVPLKLVGTGAMPILDFWNLENTFREHLIVKNLTEYKIPEASPHCVFVEDTVTLHFYSVTVNSSYCAKIDLYNNGLVSCILKMKLHYQANTSHDIFSLDRYEMQIEALLHKRLGIIFSPKVLQEYRAVLEVKLKLLHNQEQSFKLCLIGEGVIPRIRLIKPALRQNKLAVLHFPVTCLGSVSNKIISYKNITPTKCTVQMKIIQPVAERNVFRLKPVDKCETMICGNQRAAKEFTQLKLLLGPGDIASLQVFFNPLSKGRISCDIKIKIIHNPYEYFTVLCEAEAFMEDVILIGLEMLSMESDLEALLCESGLVSTVSTTDSRAKKTKSAPIDKKKPKETKKKMSMISSNRDGQGPAVLKYVLDFGGCELCVAQKRTVIMTNNSEKVYKFLWEEIDNILIKPNLGFISPGEEKDITITFFSMQPLVIRRETFTCNLSPISEDCLTIDLKGATWDNRQMITIFDHNQDISINERYETVINEQTVTSKGGMGNIIMIIVYSVTTEYTKYTSSLPERYKIKDTFIYQKRDFKFKVENTGSVPLKIAWDFVIDDEYPMTLDKSSKKNESTGVPALAIENAPEEQEESSLNTDSRIKLRGAAGEEVEKISSQEKQESRETLFSGSLGRTSVDTCFEIDLPFTIEPRRDCIKPRESRTFKVTFSPLEAFDFKIHLNSSIDNLDPYDQNLSCKITAKSLIPYVHLDIEESDYLTSGRRKATGVVLPPHMVVLEFNVLGSGCYKKTFNVINPTKEAYEFMFKVLEHQNPATLDFVPIHCNLLKGYVEGGTSTEVMFTFTPTAPGVYESQWEFIISTYNVTIPLMVVGFVREPDVIFVPTILLITNSLVGFTTNNVVMLKNNESEPLAFEFKGNSLCKEFGQTPVAIEPEKGILKPNSSTQILILYTPGQDGPLSFKLFCQIAFMTKFLPLCVNALSHLIKPTVTYYIVGNEHFLDHEVVTKIHLEQTASGYERSIPFNVKNDGSAAFFFEWRYNNSEVKKYLLMSVKPRNGFLKPGAEVKCTLYFQLKQVPVVAFPVTLKITDGPDYVIYLYAEIQKPLYHFSCKEFDFGKCIVYAPNHTYKKNLAFTNDDRIPLFLELPDIDWPELLCDFKMEPIVEPRRRAKIPIYFRPTQVKQYEFKLQFFVNSLCEEIIIIRGEGVALLVDLYEGCQKSFDLGPVRVGSKIIREIEVMNHSKVPIDATFIFKDVSDKSNEEDVATPGTSICLDPDNPIANEPGPSRVQLVKEYRDEINKQQIEMDVVNTLASLRVIPSQCIIQPHRKATLQIVFEPIGLISSLKVLLTVKVLERTRPLVLLSGSATDMSLCLSQDSLQFGRVRTRGCKILKVKLENKGDFKARFCWQPLVSDEFTIAPMKGIVAAHSNVTFTISFRPINHNPYIKLWAICNIERYKSMELALYGACLDVGVPQVQTLYIECPVREVKKEYVVVANPTDESWLVLSEIVGPAFETLREFTVEANSSFDIPVFFKPKTVGKHQGEVLFSPLGENALFVTLNGVALHPEPNGIIHITVPAKQQHTELLAVHNITGRPETYIVMVDLKKMIPDNFAGYYENHFPDTVKVWGETVAQCRWKLTCFEPCEMHYKVMFINQVSREYQFYDINVVVTPSPIIDTLKFECRARESMQKDLKIFNPLSEDAEFFMFCDKLQCAEYIKISRRSETKVTMTYTPLVVGESEGYLSLSNKLVGTMVYRVIAKCLPAKEKSLEFSTTFGQCIPIRLRIENKRDTDTVFIATTDHPSLIVDKKEHLCAPFSENKILLWFEPTQLGVQNIRVSFNSVEAGEYIFNIKGIATDPKPQGPFEVKVGGSATIKFKNVFDDTKTFEIFVDNEEFYVKSQLEQIRSKKDIRVTVYLSDKPLTPGSRTWTEIPTGTLTIGTIELGEPKIQWTFFLQGIL